MSAAVAAWVAAIAAIVFGGTGAVLGVMGFVRAGRANDAAARSNAIAEGANTLAEESNRIAQSSVDVVAAADARAVEQHDVRWDREWVEAGVYRLTNVGRHAAHDVFVQVHIVRHQHSEEEQSTGEVPIVQPGGHVDVDVEGIKPLHGALELDYAAHIGVPGTRIVPFQPEVGERVFWRSPLGMPQASTNAGQVWFDAGTVLKRRAKAAEQV